jgi:hypothetical protein
MAGQFGLRFRLPRKSQGSFTCRQSATSDRRLYFPSEGRHAVDFFRPKNPTASAGFKPAILDTTRPIKPPIANLTEHSSSLSAKHYQIYCFRKYRNFLLMSYIYGAPCKARNVIVVYIYVPTFGNAESRLFLFTAQWFNTESIQKVFLYHSCV